MERTPPIFSRNPRVAQLGSQLKYEAKDFGVDQFQQWTDADQYFKYAPREMEDVDDVVPREKREKGKIRIPSSSINIYFVIVQRTCEAMYIEEGQEKQQPSGFQLPPHLRKRLEQSKSFKYSKPRGERNNSQPNINTSKYNYFRRTICCCSSCTTSTNRRRTSGVYMCSYVPR